MAYTGSIWKDINYTASTSPLNYYITDNSGEIFRGKAVMKPTENYVEINVNKICENYVSTEMAYNSDNVTATTHSNAIKTFSLYNSGGTLLNTYTFLNSWDYKWNWTGGNATLTERIIQDTIPGQYVLSTSISGSTVSTTRTQVNSGSLSGCYVLYYLNRKGGWCDLPITGKVTKKDNYQRLNIETFFNNNNKPEYEKKPYRNNIRTSYVLRTGWLTDEQSEKVAYDVLSSNNIYLHDMHDGKDYSAYITDTAVEYKTFKQKQMVNYTINIDISQTQYIL